MSDFFVYACVIATLVASEVTYFYFAQRFSIIDKPNQRSSHSVPIIRGGGVIFVFAVLEWYVLNEFRYTFFAIGLILISAISLADDIKERPPLIRFLVHLVAFSLLMHETGITSEPVWLVAIIAIICIGTINAFNFMDGINGITGLYALTNLGTLLYINERMMVFTDTSLIVFIILGVLVFLFFNFRVRARCFAGDVGSISLAFIQLFFLLKLYQATHYYEWILLFLMFGVDTIITIIYRLKKRENIFKSHRMHLYQYFSNELKVPQRAVSVIYALIQLGMNVVLLVSVAYSLIWLSIVMMIVAGLIYFMIRESVLRKIGLKGLFTA
jgi:UDP-N-acetylmuramyl pentapeptide phosphotransferase/UDP-N-acetylglucosamine-1-phosphate transferase